MAPVIMLLDVLKVHRVRDSGLLVKVAQIIRQIGKVVNTVAIALEVPDIDGIESQERGEKTPVRFRNLITHKIALAR